MTKESDRREQQRKALRIVWKKYFALNVNDVFLDLIIDTVEGA